MADVSAKPQKFNGVTSSQEWLCAFAIKESMILAMKPPVSMAVIAANLLELNHFFLFSTLFFQ
nr:hypothetical protein [uncultured Desulfobacter sp.]